jgi:hypothetical protein
MSKDKKPRAYCSAKTASGRPCNRTPLRGTTRCWSHSFKVPGRPTKLTADIQERILDAVLEGNYLEVAAQAVGVNKTTLYRWLRKADELEAKALEHFDDELPEPGDLYQHTDPADWVYLDFRHALKSAEAFSETDLLRRASAGANGWQAPMTVLERRHPSRWRRRDTTTHELEPGAAAVLEKITPPEDKRAQVAGILADSGALDSVEDTENTDREDHDGDTGS